MLHRTENTERAKEMYENGVAAYRNGEYERAMDLFHGATRLDPREAIYYSYLGLATAHRLSRFNEAREYCEKAIEMEPFNEQLYLNLAEAYKVARQPERAAKVFEDVLKIDPGNSTALMYLKQYAEERSREGNKRFENMLKRLKR